MCVPGGRACVCVTMGSIVEVCGCGVFSVLLYLIYGYLTGTLLDN